MLYSISKESSDDWEAIHRMDLRIERQSGHTLHTPGRVYRIEDTLGKGSNAIVYHASYEDPLCAARHRVLLKELFPCIEGITRIDGRLLVPDGVKAAFDRHKASFLHGHHAHIRQLERQAGRVTGNLDSFELGGTLYAVLDCQGDQTLESLLRANRQTSLELVVRRMFALLDALSPFHENGLLHLDISTDNLLVLPARQNPDGVYEPMMLIDYNSVWDHSATDDEVFFTSKSGYSAPEARLCDSKALCPATDLFSVCAVFFEMLAGRTLTESECCGQFASRVCADAEKACALAPQTARMQAVHILRKGLHPLPRKRYQSIAELRGALGELLNRIRKKGVTHAALWEASLRGLKAIPPPEHAIALELQLNGERQPANVPLMEQATGHLLLRGPGGSGKTTLLQQLRRRYAERYHPLSSICYYVPLFRWRETKRRDTPFLHACLLEYLLPENDGGSMEDMNAELDRLLSQPLPGGAPFLLLLLDGLNEAGGGRESLLWEIRSLSEKSGVRILISTRDDHDALRLPSSFNEAVILPPDSAVVERFLSECQLTSVTPPSVRAMLDCPLLLRLYADTWQAYRSAGDSLAVTNPDFSSPDAVRSSYLRSLLNLYEAQHRESETDCLRAHYAVTHLLGFIAAEMRRRGRPALTWRQLHALLKRNFRELQSKPFALAYPDYMGKSRFMLSDVRNAEEWYDLMVREVLVNRLALLNELPDGTVTLLHESFLSGLAEENRRLRRRLLAPKAARACIPLVCATLLLGGAVLALRGLSPPMTREELAAAENLQKAGHESLSRVDAILVTQEKVRDALENRTKPLQCDLLIPPENPLFQNVLASAPWDKARMTESVWMRVLKEPEEASRLFLSALLVLTEVYDGHSSAYQSQQLSLYDELAQRYKVWWIQLLSLAYSEMSEEASLSLYEALSYARSLRSVFVTTPIAQGDLAVKRGQCEASRKLLDESRFLAAAQDEAEKWGDLESMLAELQRRLHLTKD